MSPVVLIIDDSTFARSSLRRYLQNEGYTIKEADSGEKAIEMVAQSSPDIITLDLLMPGMGGLETMHQIRPLCPKARIVVITADIQSLTRQELISAGADAFLNKPVSKDELVKSIHQLLKPTQ